MPFISRGSTKVSRMYRGTTPITHVYRGTELIWQIGYGSTISAPPPPDPTGGGWDFSDNVIGTDVSVTRAGTAWRWNSSKVLTSTATNVGRIDYDPETGLLLGLLVEPASTNLLLWSRRLAQGISGGAWITSGISVADNVLGLDGGSNKASTITASTTMATLLSPKTAAAAYYTFSAWVKRKVGYGAVDVTVDGGTTWNEVTAHILGGQWVRIGSDLVDVPQSLANPSCGIRMRESGDQLEIDLCQLEAQQSATSEIITEGSTVTRAAETMRAIAIPSAGTGRGYTFAWPLAAQMRNARWIRSLTFSSVVPDTSCAVTILYITGEPGKPSYSQTVTGALTL